MTNAFEEYLERFCAEYGMSREEALKTKIVMDVKESYSNENMKQSEES